MGSGASSSKQGTTRSDLVEQVASENTEAKTPNSENGEKKTKTESTSSNQDAVVTKSPQNDARHFRERLRIMNLAQCQGQGVDCQLYVDCLLKKEEATVCE